MQPELPTRQILPASSHIWPLALKRDFTSIIALLSEKDIREDDMGETLFALAQQAFTEQELEAAKAILFFLLEALEDNSESPPLLKLIGDIYALETNHEKAREFYGKLPLTFEAIKLCLRTYVHNHDVGGLLSLRDTIIGRITPENALHVHTLVDNCIQEIAAAPEIITPHLKLYKQNLEHLAKLPPFSSNPSLLEQYQVSENTPDRQQFLIEIDGALYGQENGVWNKIASDYAQQETLRGSLTGGANLIIRTASAKIFFSLANALSTENPQFFKYECWIVINFELLQQLLFVYNISPLLRCNYVIRCVSEQNLDYEITDMILGQELLFPNRSLFLQPEDKAFYSQIIQPVISKCENRIEGNVQRYEHQLAEMYPENHHEKVLTKIRQGEKLRILFQTSSFTSYMQYSTRDMAEGFRQLGHETFIEKEQDDAGVGIRKDICMKNLIDFQPDIIFNINHFRYEYPWIPKSIPYATWFQDLMPHMQALKDQDLITNHDFLFSFSQKWIRETLTKYPVFRQHQIHLLPITASTKKYYPIEQCKKKFDVTFVSHLPEPSHTFLPYLTDEIVQNEYSKESQDLIKKLILSLTIIPLSDLFRFNSDIEFRKQHIDHICSVVSQKNNIDLNVLRNFLETNPVKEKLHNHWLMLMKTAPISFLLKHNVNVKVFGKNWEKIPAFKDISLGPVQNGSELNKIFNQSRINLNLSPGTSYHMKAPELIAARCFMITRRIPYNWDTMPIETFFTPGKEIILFNDEADLLAKIRYFLKRPKERESIADLAYEKYLSEYTHGKTAASTIDIISKYNINK